MGLNFSFEERSYAGKTFRPRPEVHLDRNSSLLLVATPWGNRSSARKVIDRMLEYFLFANSDKEATSPFEKLTCLSPAANHLRMAALLANEMLYREDNKTEYRTGVELFGASFVENECVWLQLGQPQIILSRENGRMSPLGGYADLALDLSDGERLLPALPNQLLGLDSTVNLTINSFRANQGDKIVLLSHSAPPASFYTMKREDLTINNVSRWLAKPDPDAAFWVGLLELADETRMLRADENATITGDLNT